MADLGNHKYDTCFYKTGPAEYIEHADCCTPEVRREHYICVNPELLITDLKPEICKTCKFYKEKKEQFWLFTLPVAKRCL